MDFGTYPTGGEAISRARYQREGMKAFGTRRPDPCDDDYDMRVVSFPTAQYQGTANGEAWNTEHVMDAQIVKQFFDYLSEGGGLTPATLPAKWWSRDRNTKQIGKFGTVRPSRYMGDFWGQRKGTGDITAMDHLLAVYPGTNYATGELTLMGFSVNGKKGSIFGERAGSCIGDRNWRSMDYWDRINALRDCILLAGYMNHPTIRSHFSAVAKRIHSRLGAMEQPGGFMVSHFSSMGQRSRPCITCSR